MIREKKGCYKHLHHHESDKKRQKYKKVRKNANKAMSEAKESSIHGPVPKIRYKTE
jgi:hypothetical protein